MMVMMQEASDGYLTNDYSVQGQYSTAPLPSLLPFPSSPPPLSSPLFLLSSFPRLPLQQAAPLLFLLRAINSRCTAAMP